MTLRTSDL